MQFLSWQLFALAYDCFYLKISTGDAKIKLEVDEDLESL